MSLHGICMPIKILWDFRKTKGCHEETKRTTHGISIDICPPCKPMDHRLPLGKP